MACRFVVLTALAVAFLPLPSWGQEAKVLGKTKAEWIKILEENKEKRFRRAAVLALKNPEFPRTNDVLMAFIKRLADDPEAEVRREVALALGEIGAETKNAVALALRQEKDMDANVRANATKLLAKLGEDAVSIVEGLGQRLEKDTDPKVREAAARALGNYAAFAVVHVPKLGKALKDADPGTRLAAAEALSSFGEKARLVWPELMDAASDKKMDLFARVYVVRILGKHAGKGDKAAMVLAGILTDKTAPMELRHATATALAIMGPEAVGAAPALAQVFEDDKPGENQDKDQFQELRRVAGVALGKIGPGATAALPAVVKVMRDPEVVLRTQAVRLTGVFGKGNLEVDRQLLAMLKDEKNAEVLVAAIQETAQLGIQTAQPQLLELTNDPRAPIREAAKQSLKRLTGSEKGSEK